MKRGLVIAAIVIAIISIDTDLFSGLSQKALGLQLSKKKITDQADADWLATRKNIHREIRKIDRELNIYIETYEKQVNEYNAWALAAGLPQYRMQNIDHVNRARRLKQALRDLY